MTRTADSDLEADIEFLIDSALGGMTKLVLRWFDKALAHRRSLAACIAIKEISRLQPRPINGEGVISSAMIYPLARIVIGSAYASVYESMIAHCVSKGSLLRNAEPDSFPRTPAAATAQVLMHMGLPIEVWRPLSYADLPSIAKCQEGQDEFCRAQNACAESVFCVTN